MNFRARPASKQDGKLIPEEPLWKHLRNVGERARNCLSTSTLPQAERLSEWAWLCGVTHDFGKYTSFFQNKLPPKKQAPPKQAYGNHAFISALLAAFVAKMRYPDSLEPALLLYLAIHRHHGHLVTPSEILPLSADLDDAPQFKLIDGIGSLIKSKHLKAIQAQIANIRSSQHYQQIISEMDALGIPEVASFLGQEAWWELIGQLSDYYTLIEDKRNIELYWKATLLFSALIDADKHISAAASHGKVPDTPTRLQIPPQLVENHLEVLKQTKPEVLSDTQDRLFDIRDGIHIEATQAIENKKLDNLYPSVLSLTAPTGSGKTLTALGCAFRLRERIYREQGMLPRVIYALPFVNIINQNYEVTRQVLGQLTDFKKNGSSYLLKHHHQAPLAFKEDESRTNDESLLLTESWESEVIITTFVQLLESLITNRNRALKKLHNIAGSIVILDEIQSIPYEQWRLVEHVLTTLTEYLGCTVLQMTATRPQILTQAKELLDQPERHFSGLSRTALVPKKDVCDLDSLKGFIHEQKTPDKSMLVVVNTIHSAVELYKLLKQEADFSPYKEIQRDRLPGRCPLVHLSTNITPWQRKQRIRLLRHYMQRGGKPIVISTQVVEAGVDLDFDIVIRDQGPLDSIVQVAGRCNRNGTKGEAKAVYVVNLKRNNGTSDAQLVYGKILPNISDSILTTSLEEPELYQRIDAYFRTLPDRLSDSKSRDFIRAVDKLHFQFVDDTLSVSQYRLIDEYEHKPVIVELNDYAGWVVERLESLYQHGGSKHEFRDAYRELGNFVITPSIYRIEKNPPYKHNKIEEHYYIPKGEVIADHPRYYDLETGFIWKDETAIY